MILILGSKTESKRNINKTLGLKDIFTIKWEALNKGFLNPFE